MKLHKWIFSIKWIAKLSTQYPFPENKCWSLNLKDIVINKTSFSNHRPSGPMLSISRNVRLSVCLSLCPSVCVFTFEVPFKRLFAPTSQSRMSNIFRDLESLGKSNKKKWFQIWTFLFESCLKLPRKKKFFFADFALQNMVETTLPNGLETSGRRVYRLFWHITRGFWVFAFWMIFSVFQKNLVLGYFWSTRKPRLPMD